MAQRRMFSLRITSSARFLKMPQSAQGLYFHLCMNADDDGVVEAYSVVRMANSAEDDLKILQAKSFVHVLNDDFVTFINDWTEHNHIRADRKVDSIYKELLLNAMPDVKLIEARPRADTGKATGRPLDNQRTTTGRHRLGKVRLVKESIDNNKNISSSQDTDDELTPEEKAEHWRLLNEASAEDNARKAKHGR